MEVPRLRPVRRTSGFRLLPNPGRRNSTTHGKSKASARAPEQTFEEPKYLKRLIDSDIPVRIKLASGEEVRGVVEYYDQSFIRLTREGEPNLFIFKHEIKYLVEEGSPEE